MSRKIIGITVGTPANPQAMIEKTEQAEQISQNVEHTKDSTVHVTPTEKKTWNNKSDFSGSYNDLTNKPTIPNLNGYAKSADHYTKTESDNKYQPKGSYLTAVPSEYVTETELTNKGYATQTAVNQLSEEIADQQTQIDGKQPKGNYLTSIPSEYVTESELLAKGYAKQTDVDDLGYAVANQEETVTQNVLASLNFDVFGTVDNENNIIIENTLSGGAYFLKYENGDGTYTDIGTLQVGYVMHTITQNLTKISSNNSATTIEDGKPLTIKLIPSSGYEITSVTVKMGGVDITSSAYSNGTITIASVSGDVVITATATVPAPKYTNLYDKSKVLLNARFNSSHTATTANGTFITHWIDLPDDFATKDCFLYLKGINPTGGATISYSKVAFSEDSTVAGKTLAVNDKANSSLQFNLTTNLGVKWETLDANSNYYKIDLRRNATGSVPSTTANNKCVALALNVSSSALTQATLPDIIITMNEEIV